MKEIIEDIKNNDIHNSEYQDNNDTQVSENQVNKDINNSIKMEENKVFRFCVGEGTNPGQAFACTFDKFNELTDSERVRTICNQIASLMEGYWSLSEEEQRKRDAEKSKLKTKLPFITVHSQFFDDDEKSPSHRSNATAHDNGCVMLDIDHVNNPRDYWESLTDEQIADNGIFFACITPSKYGLHVLADRREGENIKQAQYRLGYLFGLRPEDKNETRFDKHTHDASRAAYLTPRDYILDIKPEKMCFASEEEAQSAESRKYDVKPRTAKNGQGTPAMSGISSPKTPAESPCSPAISTENPCSPLITINNSLISKQTQSTDNQFINGQLTAINGCKKEDINGTGAGAGCKKEGFNGAGAGEEVYTVNGVDIPFTDIVWALAKEIEKEEGKIQAGVNRHNYHIAWCNYLRYICENNPEKLIRIVPNLMEEDDPEGNDLRRAAADMCGYAPWKKMPKQLKAAIQSVQAKMQPEIKPFSPVEDLPIPRLPRLLQLATSHLSDPEYIAATVILALPVLGAEATGCRLLHYHDKEVNSLSFLNVVVADQGIGKSTPYKIALKLAQPLLQQSLEDEQLLDEWKESTRRCSANEQKPTKPHISRRYFSGRMTEAFMLDALKQAQGKHLLLINDEIKTLYGRDNNGAMTPGTSAWEHAFDNMYWGTDAKTIDGASGQRPMYCNVVSAVQYLRIEDYFTFEDVTGGAALRCGFAYLSHKHEKHPDPFTEEEIAEMQATAKQLMAIPQDTLLDMEHYGFLADAILEWIEEKESDYKVGEIDIAGLVILRRCPVIAYRAGYLYSLLFAPELQNCKTEEERNQIKQDCVNLMIWTAEYIYRVQHFLFAQDLYKEYDLKQKKLSAHQDSQRYVSPTAQDWYPPVLDKLPDTFTQEDFFTANGIDINDQAEILKMRNRLSYYSGGNQRAKKTFILKNPDGTYSKI